MSDQPVQDSAAEPAPPTARRDLLKSVAGVVGGLVVAAVVVLGIVAYVNRDTNPTAASGAFLSESTLPDGPTHSASVKLPWGSIMITAGAVRSHIEDNLYSDKYKADYPSIDAPDGGGWIPLDIEPDVSLEATLVRSKADAEVPVTKLSVVAGDQTISLASATGDAGKAGTGQRVASVFPQGLSGFLALPDRPSDLHIRVEFGGVTQDVFVDSGRIDKHAAAPLYTATPDTTLDVKCGKGTVPGYRVSFAVPDACHLTHLAALPYVAGLGWAKSGRRWLVAIVRTYPPDELRKSGDGSKQTYYSDRLGQAWKASLRYGSSVAVATGNYNDVNSGFALDPESPQQFIFDVALGDVGRSAPFTLVTRFTAEREGHGREIHLISTRMFSASR